MCGCLSGDGLGPLVPVKGTLNASAHQEMLDNSMLPTLWEQFGDGPFLFQHDCAPVHKARSIKTWRREFGVENGLTGYSFIFMTVRVCYVCMMPYRFYFVCFSDKHLLWVFFTCMHVLVGWFVRITQKLLNYHTWMEDGSLPDRNPLTFET